MDVLEESKHRLEAIESELKVIDSKIEALKSTKARLEDEKGSLQQLIEGQQQQLLQNIDWEQPDPHWYPLILEALEKHFKLTSLRPLQLSAMQACLSAKDAFLIMPTGGGKSLCYQLPALLLSGFTLVVSPLVALMQDQVMALRRLGIAAELLNADVGRQEHTRILNAMTQSSSGLKLLYVTPERLAKSKRFVAKLQAAYKQGLFARLAVDEVHCCSHWGHDFRPDYKFLGVMRSLFPTVSILGLTATATEAVIDDCKNILNIKHCLTFRARLNRPNLFYKVMLRPESQNECLETLQQLLLKDYSKQSGIIYSFSIKDVETLSQGLRQRGIKASAYHSNMRADQREKVHNMWLEEKLQVIVATIAFGMGIDKANVRFVIHHAISKSIENYYQESGRAGRDGLRAECVALFKFADVFRLSTMVFTEKTGLDKLYSLVKYCIDHRRCRREMIAEHFGESWDSISSQCNSMCDNCQNSSNIQSTDSENKLLYLKVLELIDLADSLEVRLTPLKLCKALMGKGDVKQLRLENSKMDGEKADHLILDMLVEGFLKEDFAFTAFNTFTYLIATPKLRKMKENAARNGSSNEKCANRHSTEMALKKDSKRIKLQ